MNRHGRPYRRCGGGSPAAEEGSIERPDFITGLGAAFLAHRLRRASESILDATGPFLREQGISAPPRAISTLLLLDERGALGITGISTTLRLTHPLIIKLVRALADSGYVSEERDPQDSRRRLISLTDEGRRQAAIARRLNVAVARAFAGVAAETGTDLLDAVARFEAAIRAKPLADRLARALRDAPPD
jgi:DNA-binding MarR family transcriptional regulator